MKKIFTLTVLALFMSISAMADFSLGELGFSIKNGAVVRMSKITKSGIKVTFPNVVDNKYENITLSAVLTADDFEFAWDGVEGTYAGGVVFNGIEGLANDVTYTFKVKELIAGEGEEITFDEGSEPTITFTVKDLERRLSWNLAQSVTAEEEEAIKANIASENPIWKDATNGAKSRFQIGVDLNEEMLTTDGTTPISMTEGLYITTKSSYLLVAQQAGTSVRRLHLAQPGNKILIPDCNVGDKIAIKHGYVDTKKEYSIQIPNATCPDATNEAKDSIRSEKSQGIHVFTVHTAGDLEIIVNNSVIGSIDITPASDQKYKYTVVAQDPEGNVLKTLQEEKEGDAGDIISVPYSYWLKNEEGKIFTLGSRGTEFKIDFTLKSDTTFVAQYKSTNITDAVYCTEAEDLIKEGSTAVALVTQANSAVRSSNKAAAYNSEDIELCKLNAGTYKIEAIIFDASNAAGHIEKFTVGTEEIELAAQLVNFSDETSNLITVTEDNTPVVWKAGTSTENAGLDAVIIYPSTDEPEDEPDGIKEVSVAKAAKAVKAIKNGAIVITKNGNVYNAVGAQIK